MSPMRSDLENKVILITGASRGIGRSVALNCAKAGAEVIITGRTMGALEELDDEISKAGGKATIVELDQTDTAAMARLGQAVAARWGRLDGFVANAGQLGQMAPMPHIDRRFAKTIVVNLTSIWYQIAAFDTLYELPTLVVLFWYLAAQLRCTCLLGCLCSLKSWLKAMAW